MKGSTDLARPKNTDAETVVEAPAPPALDKRKPDLQHIAGSRSDDWNIIVINQAINSIWRGSKTDEAWKKRQHKAVVASLAGLAQKTKSRECWRANSLPRTTRRWNAIGAG